MGESTRVVHCQGKEVSVPYNEVCCYFWKASVCYIYARRFSLHSTWRYEFPGGRVEIVCCFRRRSCHPVRTHSALLHADPNGNRLNISPNNVCRSRLNKQNVQYLDVTYCKRQIYVVSANSLNVWFSTIFRTQLRFRAQRSKGIDFVESYDFHLFPAWFYSNVVRVLLQHCRFANLMTRYFVLVFLTDFKEMEEVLNSTLRNIYFVRDSQMRLGTYCLF